MSSSHRDFLKFVGLPSLGLVAAGVAVLALANQGQTDPVQSVATSQGGLVHERLGDAPAPPSTDTFATMAQSIFRGGYQSIQVNVDSLGRNVANDAANEPSITIDYANPSRVAIGWRQFNSVTSNFREAGFNYSRDRGRTWAGKGNLQPGTFRSDPVLETGETGVFHYHSLTSDFLCQNWISNDGGQSWSGPFNAFGGDKQWTVIDRTNSSGRGFYYASWSPNAGCCSNRIFSRSVDGGRTWSSPVSVSRTPMFGILDVGPDGEVYVFGIENNNFNSFVLAKSTNARDRNQTPSFTTRSVSMGGAMVFQPAVNPDGLMGQATVAVDRSNGSRRGWVYLLCSVDPSGSDPADVRFARSTDGGVTFSASRKLNTDSSTSAWQWFGAMSVAPNGRIDVCWYDTTASPNSTRSELFYTYSYDGGDTWKQPIPVSPSFAHGVGYPNQRKLGDYIDMVSDDQGPYIAYAATFNGEQDVYFMRINLNRLAPPIQAGG
jgi:hypothetical protein